MFFLIKFFLYFSVSYLILCFPIKNSTLFSYTYRHSSPLTKKVYEKIIDKSEKLFKSGIKFSKDLFNNSLPKHLDEINSSLSSIKKDKATKIEHSLKKESLHENYQDKHETYTEEDAKLLRDLFKGSH